MTEEDDEKMILKLAGDRIGDPLCDPGLDDDAFDRALAAQLTRSGDHDVALLSRSVLSALSEDSAVGTMPQGEVLSEPLTWGAGFAGLLLLFAGIGYAAVPLFDGGTSQLMSDMSGLMSLLGGM